MDLSPGMLTTSHLTKSTYMPAEQKCRHNQERPSQYCSSAARPVALRTVHAERICVLGVADQRHCAARLFVQGLGQHVPLQDNAHISLSQLRNCRLVPQRNSAPQEQTLFEQFSCFATFPPWKERVN
jgi:hypothetical protein